MKKHLRVAGRVILMPFFWLNKHSSPRSILREYEYGGVQVSEKVSSHEGLPTALGMDVLHALLEVWHRQSKPKTEFGTTGYELMKVLKLKHSGANLRHIREQFKRLASTTALREAVKKEGEKIIKDRVFFHLFDKLSDHARFKGPILVKKYSIVCKLSEEIIKNYDDNFWQNIDFDVYLSLRPAAKRLYEIVLWRHHRSRKNFLSVDELVKRIPIECQSNKEARRALKNSAEDLLRAGVLRKYSLKGDALYFRVADHETSVRVESGAEDLVKNFWKLWKGAEPADANPKEVRLAKDLIKELGSIRAGSLIKFAVREAPKTRFEMAHFGAVTTYKSRFLAESEVVIRTKEAVEKQDLARKTEMERIRREDSEHAAKIKIYADLAAELKSKIDAVAHKIRLTEYGHIKKWNQRMSEICVVRAMEDFGY